MLSLLATISVRPRQSWLITLCALAALLLGLSEPALAQCSGTPDNVTCPISSDPLNPYSFGFAGNPYSPPGSPGINVNTDDGLGGTPITLTLQSGVNVIIPAGPGSVNAVNTHNSGGVTSGSADISIIADDVTITNLANPGTSNNTALRIQSSGAATITATNTTIDVAGTASTWGILAFAQPNGTGIGHDVSVNWSGPHLNSTTGIEGGRHPGG
jgi:hypothetical protein